MHDHADIPSEHPTWKELIPSRTLNQVGQSGETLEQYIKRIKRKFKNIPNKVLEQWLYLHTSDPYVIQNYAWIDYTAVRFTEVLWSYEQIAQIQVFSEFRYYVEMRTKTNSLEQFMCVAEDKAYWEMYGTWRIPIIVLNTQNLSNPPRFSELNKPFQLVEGHSRLGYYKAFYRYFQQGLVQMPNLHKIFLMEVR